MKEEKRGRFGNTWNILALIILAISLVFISFDYIFAEGPALRRGIEAFTSVVSITYTIYQIYKRKPDGYFSELRRESYILRKSIDGSATWITNQLGEKIFQSEENIKKHISAEVDRKLNADDENEKITAYNEADLRILGKLWPHITPRIINHIVERVGTATLEFDFVLFSLLYFQNLRRDHPELHFINENIETAFSQFEVELSKFTRFLGNNATAEFFNGRYVYLSGYQEATKQHPGLNALMGIDESMLQNLLNRHNQIEDKAVEMQQAYQVLLKKLQRLLPKFDFPDDLTALNEMDEYRRQMNNY